jgi:hypothetical protein
MIPASTAGIRNAVIPITLSRRPARNHSTHWLREGVKGNHLPRERPRLALAAESVATPPDEHRPVVTAADLAGLDLTRVPQELAGHIPAHETPWQRGTSLPPVETPEGRQALCFGTADELRPLAAQWRGGVAINSARTLWVVTVRG